MIYSAWSAEYTFEYSYLILWNVFWSLCAVIAIGLFDRLAGKHLAFILYLISIA